MNAMRRLTIYPSPDYPSVASYALSNGVQLCLKQILKNESCVAPKHPAKTDAKAKGPSRPLANIVAR